MAKPTQQARGTASAPSGRELELGWVDAGDGYALALEAGRVVHTRLREGLGRAVRDRLSTDAAREWIEDALDEAGPQFRRYPQMLEREHQRWMAKNPHRRVAY